MSVSRATAGQGPLPQTNGTISNDLQGLTIGRSTCACSGLFPACFPLDPARRLAALHNPKSPNPPVGYDRKPASAGGAAIVFSLLFTSARCSAADMSAVRSCAPDPSRRN
jgi:hypothetical protein